MVDGLEVDLRTREEDGYVILVLNKTTQLVLSPFGAKQLALSILAQLGIGANLNG